MARAADVQWPAITNQTKPWTRWWWLGNIGTNQDFTTEMEKYAQANLGGMELTSIYGVKGEEDKFLQYLSPEWVARFQHILQEGRRLNLGIDLATGNGWPFGGPWVTPDIACKTLLHKTYTLTAGQTLAEPITMTQEPFYRSAGTWKGDQSTLKDPIASNANLQLMAMDQIVFARQLPLHALLAYSSTGQMLDLTGKVSADGKLDWTAPAGTWTLHALFLGWHGKQVERAGPGGEGDVIDHMTSASLMVHLGQFDKAFAGKDIKPRAFFNDSYEVDDATRSQHNWTPKFFDEFSKRRGYDLRPYMPALLAAGGPDSPATHPSTPAADQAARVISDYRETVSDLILEEYTQPWAAWAAGRGSVIRNQSHGSPANMYDLYAASGIPETEGGNTLRSKFVSSTSHVVGHPLASSESATWAGGHFTASLADIKPIMDRFLVGGINHIFYHGTPFSPPAEPWPGFMFYAGAEFTPNNTWWDDFAAFNMYVARCQSFLQSGKSDEGVLLFYSVHDQLGGLTTSGRAGSPPGAGGSLPLIRPDEGQAGAVAQSLYNAGHSYDYISDRHLANITFSAGTLRSSGGTPYRAIIVPQYQLIALASMEKLIQLAQAGATVIVQNRLPADVPGLGTLDARRARFQTLVGQLKFAAADSAGIQIAPLGQGRVLMGANLDALLTRAGIKRETMVQQGLNYIRRAYDDGRAYFIVNNGRTPIDGWVPIQQSNPASAAIFDPLAGTCGLASTRKSADDATEVYLQLLPGDSCIVRTYNTPIQGAAYAYWKSAGDAVPITGTWSVRFIKGGPELPAATQVAQLKSWTEFGGDQVKNFSGTAAYAITFPRPAPAQAWQLDLGSVLDSAHVTLNGKPLGTVFKAPYRLILTPDMLADFNTLEVAVSNQMINRIAEMDRKGQEFRRFYNANVDRAPSFANTPPRASGLVGPVQLVPLTKADPLQATP